MTIWSLPWGHNKKSGVTQHFSKRSISRWCNLLLKGDLWQCFQFIWPCADSLNKIKVKPTIIFQAPFLKKERMWDQGCLPLSLTLALDQFTRCAFLHMFCFVNITYTIKSSSYVLVLNQSKLDNPTDKRATFENFYLSGSNFVRAYM